MTLLLLSHVVVASTILALLPHSFHNVASVLLALLFHYFHVVAFVIYALLFCSYQALGTYWPIKMLFFLHCYTSNFLVLLCFCFLCWYGTSPPLLAMCSLKLNAQT